jgi:hypothetical protein
MPSPLRRRSPLAVALLLAATFLLAALSPFAQAQGDPLERLAPRDTVLALGLTPGPLPDGTLGDALAALDVEAARTAWRRLGEAAEDLDLGDLGRLPMQLAMPLDMLDDMAGGLSESGGLAGELADSCPGLEGEVTALMEDAWADDLLLSVAMDPFAPLPGLLAVARVRPDAAPAAGALHDRLVACFGGETVGTQDGVDMVVLGDGGDLPLVVARRGELFLAGTRPDLVRGAIRRAAGAAEPSLADDPSFLGAADAPGLRLTVRPDLLADIAEARVPAPREGMDVALARAASTLRTLGSFSASVAIDDDGLRTRSALALRRDGGDAELADLLACETCRASGPYLASDDAVAVAGSKLRLRAWIDWLDGLVADLSEAAGEPTSLRTLLEEQAGIDVDASLLSWIGDEMHTVRYEPFSPDLRDLLQQPPSIVAIPVASAEDAEAGLAALAGAALALADRLSALDDDFPDAATIRGMVAVDERESAGVPYHRVRVGPTDEYAVGVVGNRLVIAGPARAFDRVVALQQGTSADAFASEGWRAVQEASGDGARIAWRYGDVGADLRGVSALVRTAVQPAAFAAWAALEGAASEAGGPDETTAPWGAAPRIVDLATAERYGAPNLAGDPAGASAGDPWSVAPTVDLAAAERYGAARVAGLSPVDLDVPAVVEDAAFTQDAPTVDGSRMDLYRLPVLPAGTEVTVAMTSDAFDTYLYLIDPDAGALLGENDDAPNTSRSEIRYVSDGVTRPWIGASTWGSFGEGPYGLEVTGADAEAPAPGAEPEAEAEPVVPTDVDAPGSAGGVLGADATYIDGSPMDLYRLPVLPAGAEVTVAMTSDAFDTYLYLIDPDAEAYLAENDDAPDTSRSEVRYVSDGVTRPWIGASTWGSFGEGPYELSVEVAGAEAPGENAEAEAEDDAAELPTFAELLPAFDLLPDAFDVVAARVGGHVHVVTSADDVVRGEGRVTIDW